MTSPLVIWEARCVWGDFRSPLPHHVLHLRGRRLLGVRPRFLVVDRIGTKVVGGSDKGGILVRSGQDLKSPEDGPLPLVGDKSSELG